MTSKIDPNISKSDLFKLLDSLKTANKQTHWICKDLKVKKQGWFGKLCWNLVFKHFEWTRKLFDIDPGESKYNLVSLKDRVKVFSDTTLNKKYVDAIHHFNNIFSHHWIHPIVSDDLSTTPSSTSSTTVGRSEHLTNLNENLQALETKLNNFDANAEEIIKLCKNILIGLSQTPNFVNFNANYQFEKYLPDYVGKNPYSTYVNENLYTDTRKVRKGAPLSLIKAMSISHARVNAFEAVESLIKDYLDHGSFSPHNDQIALTVYALSRGYYDNHPNKSAAAGNLKIWWKNAPEHLDKLKSHPYKIPLDTPFNSNETGFTTPNVNGNTAAIPLNADSPPQIDAKWTYFKEVEQKTGDAELMTLIQLLTQAIEDEEVETSLWLIEEKNVSLTEIAAEVKSSHPELITWLTARAAGVEVDPQNLDHLALDIGYGYKSANLMVLDKETDKINESLKTAVVKVPPFLPISDFEMRNDLFKANPEIETQWNAFLDSFEPDVKAQFLARDPSDPKIPPLKITPKGQALIASIQKKVTAHFSQNIYKTPQIMEWLQNENPELVIIRSTGKEDTEDNSNAGGNDSVPFVKPDAKIISETIGRVLASYFGEKSVSQRLLAGDKTLFTQAKPFLPVLIQTMVLENGTNAQVKNPLDIPRSGVLFTTQKDKAEDVTFIQTGLGNNEGVVSSQVAVDSYFVDKKGNVHTVVRDKQTRFVRVEKSGKYEAAQINNNNPEMQRSQALPIAVIRDLKKVSDAIAYHYSKEEGVLKPLDMEYTVKLNQPKPVIYLLQARPLVTSAIKSDPSYFDMSKIEKISKEDKLSATILIDIRNDIRNIEGKDQIIFADTLPKALEAYTHAEDPQKIKAVVVRKSAPATSHESVVLRPKGVAVLVISDSKEYAKAEAMTNDATGEKPLKIDTQHGVLISTQNIDNHKSIEKKGLVSYPIPREVSIPQAPIFGKIYAQKNIEKAFIENEIEQVEARYKALVKDLLSGSAPFSFDLEKSDSFDLHRLLDVIATGDQATGMSTNDAKRALATLLIILHAKMHQNLKNANGFQSKFQQPLFNAFQYALTLSEKEIVPSLYRTEPQSMERLYPLKFLEAVIFQQTNHDTVAADSYAASLKMHKSQNEALKKAKALKLQLEDTPYAGQIVNLLEMGTKASASKKTSDQWQAFVKDLANSQNAELIAKASALFMRMNNFKLFPLGLNIAFIDLYVNKNKKFDSVVKILKTEMNANNNTLNWIQENQMQLPTEQQITNWGNPEFAGKQMTSFKGKFLKTFGFGLTQSNNIVQRYLSATLLGKLALLEYMNSCVTAYDTVIKQVTGSSSYPEDRKLQAKHFAGLLDGYFEMMQTSLKIIPLALQKSLMQVNMGHSYSFNEFVTRLNTGKICAYGIGGFAHVAASAKNQTSANPESLLIARQNFSVAPVVIGSKIDMDFYVEWPKTLEEYFTTFHQNMEAVRNVMTNELGLDKSILSDQPEEFCTQIEKAFATSFVPKIAAIIQNESEVEISYNIPLRQHAGSLVVKFNPQKPELGTKITVKMMGNHEHNRWYQAAMVGAWLGNSPPLSLADNIPPLISWNNVYENTQSVEFTLQVPSNYKQTQQLMQTLFFCMQTMTMKSHSNGKVIEKLESISPLSNLKSGFFNDTRFGVQDVLNMLNHQNEDLKLAAAIKTTLLSLLKGQLINANAGHGTSTSETVLKKCIEDLVDRNPNAIIGIIDDLSNNQELKKRPPALWNVLVAQKPKLLPPDELFDQAFSKKDWSQAILLEIKYNNFAWRVKIFQEIKDLSPDKQMELYKSLNSNQKALFEKVYLSKINQNQSLKHFIEKIDKRGKHFTDLTLNLNTLKTKLVNFNVNAVEIVELSKFALIGLSQAPDYRGYNASFQFEAYLPDFVGKAPYHYICDNVHNDTKKIRKGAPLSIIKAMSIPSARDKAFEAVETLIQDYLDNGSTSAHKDDMRVAVYALSKGYYDNNPDKAAAAGNLRKWWGNTNEHINNLKSNYLLGSTTLTYNIAL